MANGDIASIILSMEPIAEKLLVQFVMGFLDVSTGFFALPIINQITEFIVSQMVDLLVNRLGLVTINIVTVVETAIQENGFNQAAQANVEAQANGTDQEKAKAQADLIAAARSFYKFSNP